MNIVPICLFTYNRLNETKQTLDALKNNYLATQSELHIFSDGAKNQNAQFKVDEVRKYLRTIRGFKKVTIYESKINKGLAKSIISGVSKILEYNESVIVMEDDLVTTKNYLDFMNQSLNFYQSDKKVFSTTGYSLNLPSLSSLRRDFYFGYRAFSWGWGTWADRWNVIDWEVTDYEEFIKDKKAVKSFKRGGSDMPRMLRKQMIGKIDSWAIRFGYHQFRNDLITVFPKISKLESIGFSSEATNTSGTKRFITPIDTELKRDFQFEKFAKMNETLVKEFASFFSVKSRVINQINQLKQKFK